MALRLELQAFWSFGSMVFPADKAHGPGVTGAFHGLASLLPQDVVEERVQAWQLYERIICNPTFQGTSSPTHPESLWLLTSGPHRPGAEVRNGQQSLARLAGWQFRRKVAGAGGTRTAGEASF